MEFIATPIDFFKVGQGKDLSINCTVDDLHANVSLWSHDGLSIHPWVESLPTAGRILKNGQVFILVNCTGRDMKEQYKCKATDGNDTVEWSDDMGYVLFSPASKYNSKSIICLFYLPRSNCDRKATQKILLSRNCRT